MAYILDTSLLLGGKEPPSDARWITTPEAAAEIRPGGPDHRRLEGWKAAGLQIRSASPAAMDRAAEVAMSAGNFNRLTVADQSVVALAHELKAILITDDKTVQDIAVRLGVQVRGVNNDTISGTVDWKPRCTGCGKWFDAPQKRDECPICGSPVASKPVRSG